MTREHLQVRAYFRWQYRLRHGLPGDHLADWYHACEWESREEHRLENRMAGLAPLRKP